MPNKKQMTKMKKNPKTMADLEEELKQTKLELKEQRGRMEKELEKSREMQASFDRTKKLRERRQETESNLIASLQEMCVELGRNSSELETKNQNLLKLLRERMEGNEVPVSRMNTPTVGMSQECKNEDCQFRIDQLTHVHERRSRELKWKDVECLESKRKILDLEDQLKIHHEKITSLESSAQRRTQCYKDEHGTDEESAYGSKHEEIGTLKEELEEALKSLRTVKSLEQELKVKDDKLTKCSEKNSKLFAEKIDLQKSESEAKREIVALRERLKTMKMELVEIEKDKEEVQKTNKRLESKIKMLDSEIAEMKKSSVVLNLHQSLRMVDELREQLELQQEESRVAMSGLKDLLKSKEATNRRLETEAAEKDDVLESYQVALDTKQRQMSVMNSELLKNQENLQKTEDELDKNKVLLHAEFEKSTALELKCAQLEQTCNNTKGSNIRDDSTSKSEIFPNNEMSHLQTINQMLADENRNQKMMIEHLMKQKPADQSQSKSGIEDRVKKLEADNSQMKEKMDTYIAIQRQLLSSLSKSDASSSSPH